MSTIQQRLTTNWHVMRIFRTGIGLWMLVMGIQSHDWMIGLFGTFFLYQGVMDAGCCGTQGCYTPPTKKMKHTADKVQEVEYEEVK